MLGTITISAGTYASWQATLVVLSIVSTSLNIWKMTRGAKAADEATSAMKSEIKDLLQDVKADIALVRQDVEDTTQRLESHIDRTNTPEVPAPTRRRRKAVEAE